MKCKKVIKTLNNKSKQLSADQFSQKGRQYILDINGPFLYFYGVYEEEKGGDHKTPPYISHVSKKSSS